MKAPEAFSFSPAHPKLPRQLVLREGYVEDAFEVRATQGKRRVLARRGWAGEISGLFQRPAIRECLSCHHRMFVIGGRASRYRCP